MNIKYKIYSIAFLLSIGCQLLAQNNYSYTLNIMGNTGTIGTNIYDWSVGEATAISSLEKPDFLLTQGLLQAQLGYLVTKNQQDLFAPDAFTPNGDGINDYLFPFITSKIKQLKYFKVYNRWGNLLYETNYLDPSLGWNGTYKGIPQPSETYIWVAEAIDLNGNVVRSGGNALLIR